MPSREQSADDIRSLLQRLEGRKISSLQVLGINSLKSATPHLDQLSGQTITGSEVSDLRTFKVGTLNFWIAFDLQRTGRVVWLEAAEPYSLSAGTARPTARLLLADGTGCDLTEPAKTKRITVSLGHRHE